MIRAEIEANNAKVTQLADEQGWKGCSKRWRWRRSVAAMLTSMEADASHPAIEKMQKLVSDVAKRTIDKLPTRQWPRQQ
jgi:hypothetical protein